MTDTLDVVARKESGSRHCRRLRRDGMVPAILYGHGGACVELAASKEAVEAVIRHGSRLVELRGAVKESAVVRDLQWDAMGSEPIHLDLLRVSKTDRVRVRVPVDMKGECPGQRGGGIVTLVLHEIELECTADSIPDRVHVSIGAGVGARHQGARPRSAARRAGDSGSGGRRRHLHCRDAGLWRVMSRRPPPPSPR